MLAVSTVVVVRPICLATSEKLRPLALSILLTARCERISASIDSEPSTCPMRITFNRLYFEWSFLCKYSLLSTSWCVLAHFHFWGPKGDNQKEMCANAAWRAKIRMRQPILPWGDTEYDLQIRYHSPNEHPADDLSRRAADVAMAMEVCHSIAYLCRWADSTPGRIRKALRYAGFDFDRLVADQYRAGCGVEQLRLGHACTRKAIIDILNRAGVEVRPGRGTRSPSVAAVQAAIAEHGGISKAAAALRIDRSTIRRILRTQRSGNPSPDTSEHR